MTKLVPKEGAHAWRFGAQARRDAGLLGVGPLVVTWRRRIDECHTDSTSNTSRYVNSSGGSTGARNIRNELIADNARVRRSGDVPAFKARREFDKSRTSLTSRKEIRMARVTRLLNSYLVVLLLPSLLSASSAHAQTPGNISIVTPLALDPASPGVNASTNATFTVQNTGGQAITAQAFLVGARDPSNANVDFPGTGAVTLQPGQQYTYSASRSFAVKGTYTDWPVWFDGTNWNELAAHTTFTVADVHSAGAGATGSPTALNPADTRVAAAANGTHTSKTC